MKIILLSGGSGKRLWPLSNDARSKQFLRVLTSPGGGKESMIQRVVRQIKSTPSLDGEIIVATSASQRDAVTNQLGHDITIIAEPERRKTFPSIMLACAWLAANGADAEEPVLVLPCDTYADDSYFATIGEMAECIRMNMSNLMLLGVKPVYPSTKYGYILPEQNEDGDKIMHVESFVEKPDVEMARELISKGALWNGGVFGFRLGYVLDNMKELYGDSSYDFIYANYDQLPMVSFDHEVAEAASERMVVRYDGEWKDLGTWLTLTDELKDKIHGNVLTEKSESSYFINELEMPLVAIDAKDMVVAASPDGILVTSLRQSEDVKHLIDGIGRRPMYEERRWGEYKVIDSVEFEDGFCALTKQLTLRPGCCISYQRHSCRDEVWTFISGEGVIVLDGVRKPVKRGDVIVIPKGMMHALRADTSLTFIEVQHGSNLIEEDIERFDYDWEDINSENK